MEYYVKRCSSSMNELKHSDELQHHGILGMKWGVRRYQNYDGSYTQAGKERYSSKGTQQANSKVKEYSKILLSGDEASALKTQRSKNAAITGLSCIKEAVYKNGPETFDPYDKDDQIWFMLEDQTYGMPQIADLANKGYSEQKIKSFIEEALDAFNRSDYKTDAPSDGTDISGVYELFISGYDDSSIGKYINNFIHECVEYNKNRSK